MAKGKITKLAIQALTEVGQKALTQELDSNIIELLKKENKKRTRT